MEITHCPQCGTPVEFGHVFCGQCGYQLPIEEPDAGDAVESRFSVEGDVPAAQQQVVLNLLRSETRDRMQFPIEDSGASFGRDEGDITFPEDPSVSPRHSKFFFQDNILHVEDLGSANGIFVKIDGSIPLSNNDIFIVGEQYLQFRIYRSNRRLKDDDGTYFCGTPVAPWRYQIVQILPMGKEGAVYCSNAKALTIGREDCDINFPVDRFISYQHALIEEREGKHFLTDRKSRNGTYIQVKKTMPLKDNQILFIGKQLIRVEYS